MPIDKPTMAPTYGFPLAGSSRVTSWISRPWENVGEEDKVVKEKLKEVEVATDVANELDDGRAVEAIENVEEVVGIDDLDNVVVGGNEVADVVVEIADVDVIVAFPVVHTPAAHRNELLVIWRLSGISKLSLFEWE